jgi:hypothetical protein
MVSRALREPLGCSRKLGECLIDLPQLGSELTDLLHALANCPKARSASVHDRSTGSRFSKRHFGARKHKNGPQTQIIGVLCWLNGRSKFGANGGFTLRVASPQRPPSILLRRPLFPSMWANWGKPRACGGRHAAAHGQPPSPEESGGGAHLGLAHQPSPPGFGALFRQRSALN